MTRNHPWIGVYETAAVKQGRTPRGADAPRRRALQRLPARDRL